MLKITCLYLLKLVFISLFRILTSVGYDCVHMNMSMKEFIHLNYFTEVTGRWVL